MSNLRVITEDQGRSLAVQYALSYFETSAKNEQGVKEAFDFIGYNIISLIQITPSYLQHTKDSILLRANTVEKKKPKCCE